MVPTTDIIGMVKDSARRVGSARETGAQGSSQMEGNLPQGSQDL